MFLIYRAFLIARVMKTCSVFDRVVRPNINYQTQRFFHKEKIDWENAGN
jgi:hypothetical protein